MFRIGTIGVVGFVLALCRPCAAQLVISPTPAAASQPAPLEAAELPVDLGVAAFAHRGPPAEAWLARVARDDAADLLAAKFPQLRVGPDMPAARWLLNGSVEQAANRVQLSLTIVNRFTGATVASAEAAGQPVEFYRLIDVAAGRLVDQFATALTTPAVGAAPAVPVPQSSMIPPPSQPTSPTAPSQVP